MLVIFLLVAYLIGSIPFGYLISKTKGIDIRKKGSGNIGATNVSRSLGIKYAILVGILDVTKGALPIFLMSFIVSNEFILALIGAATILGSIFPVFLEFKGGKGVSAYAGTLLVILGFGYFLIAALLWLAYLYISRLMSLTNLTASLILPAVFLFVFKSDIYFLYSLTCALIIWYSHRANIQRLTKGEEHKLNLPIFI